MKRMAAFILAVFFLLAGWTGGIAESEETAQEIFNHLAEIYDETMYYLEQLLTTWDHVLTVDAKSVGKRWYMDHILTSDQERGLDIYQFAIINDYTDPYEDLLVPLLDYYGRNEEGVRQASFAFINMIFYDTKLSEKLEEQKSAIKELGSTDPDYAYLKELQTLYKKTYQVVDYAISGNDNYRNTAERISDYDQVRREQKSEFDFVFDWPEYTYRTLSLEDPWKTIIGDWHAAEDKEKEAEYQAALGLESSGKYRDAMNAFTKLAGYRDSDQHLADCREILEKHEYDYIGGFGNGLFNVRRNGKWGYIDRQGNVVIEIQYEMATRFSEGYAWVQNEKENYGLIDQDGNLVIPFKYWHVQAFSNGTYNVQERGGNWKKIDLSEKVLETYKGFPPSFENELEEKYREKYPDFQFDSVIDGYAPVWNRKTQKWGCLNSKGELVIPCEYDRVGCGGGLFGLIKDGYLTIVDEEGNTIF